MAKPIQGQILHPAAVEQSLMADLFFGTPLELDNRSSEYNIMPQNGDITEINRTNAQ